MKIVSKFSIVCKNLLNLSSQTYLSFKGKSFLSSLWIISLFKAILSRSELERGEKGGGKEKRRERKQGRGEAGRNKWSRKGPTSWIPSPWTIMYFLKARCPLKILKPLDDKKWTVFVSFLLIWRALRGRVRVSLDKICSVYVLWVLSRQPYSPSTGSSLVWGPPVHPQLPPTSG